MGGNQGPQKGVKPQDGASTKVVFAGFKDSTILQEAGDISSSDSAYWWLNSGGLFLVDGGIGKTVQGELSTKSNWYKLYLATNPRDTDNGVHPQNIFRLVNRNKYLNFRQEMYFKIVRDHLSASEFRNESNGVLFFNRYADGNNLYYAGIRVDGYAVVKKKIDGTYYQMALEKVFDGPPYDLVKSPDILPKNVFMGLRTEVRNIAGGKVNVKVFMDIRGNGHWKQIISVDDEDGKYGGPVLRAADHAGIRTDFMDVEFKNYKIEEL